MTWLVSLMLAIVFAALLCFAVTWILFRLWCRPQRVTSPVSPADYALDFEAVHFSSQGVRLQGWFIPAPHTGSKAPAVVLMHGWNHHAGRMLDLAAAFHKAGCAALLFDARGHGRSPADGPVYVLKFAQDILAAIDCLQRRPEVDPLRIAVAGHSMGGSAAILAAAMDPRIRAISSSSAFSDPSALTRDTLRKLHLPLRPFLPLMQAIFRRWIGMPIRQVSPRERIGEINVPILLAHSDCDDHILPIHFETLLRRADPEWVQAIVLNGCKHSDMLGDPSYIARVTDFLSAALNIAPRVPGSASAQSTPNRQEVEG